MKDSCMCPHTPTPTHIHACTCTYVYTQKETNLQQIFLFTQVFFNFTIQTVKAFLNLSGRIFSDHFPQLWFAVSHLITYFRFFNSLCYFGLYTFKEQL